MRTYVSALLTIMFLMRLDFSLFTACNRAPAAESSAASLPA